MLQKKIQEWRVHGNRVPFNDFLAATYLISLRKGVLNVSRGSRTDLARLHEQLREGKSDRDLSNELFATYLRNYRGISQWRILNTVPRSEKTRVIIFHGPTGTGKTRAAIDMCPEAYLFSPDSNPAGVGWWDGYGGSRDVIIDDFYGGLRFSFMLQLLDRYPLRLQTKGGSVPFVASRIVITSNKHPADWYSYDKFGPHAWPAFDRRLDAIYDCQPDIWWKQK